MKFSKSTLVALLAASLTQVARAQQLPNRVTLDALLGGNQTLEDFESFVVAANSAALLGDTSGQGAPEFMLDSSTVELGQGPGLVADGATYVSGESILQWLGDGLSGGATRHPALFGQGDQQLVYSPPVQVMGLDAMSTGLAHAWEMDVYDTNDILIQSIGAPIPNVNGTRVSLGYQHAAGIGRVQFRNNPFIGNGTRFDEHGYGDIQAPPVLADECSGVSNTYLGDIALEIDTNNCSDTLAPATTSAAQSGLCPNANNDGWVAWQPTVTGTVSLSLCNAASFDTVLAVYEESSTTLCQGTLVACNDDGTGCAGFTSEL